jgi:hypothetical protein
VVVFRSIRAYLKLSRSRIPGDKRHHAEHRYTDVHGSSGVLRGHLLSSREFDRGEQHFTWQTDCKVHNAHVIQLLHACHAVTFCLS